MTAVRLMSGDSVQPNGRQRIEPNAQQLLYCLQEEVKFGSWFLSSPRGQQICLLNATFVFLTSRTSPQCFGDFAFVVGPTTSDASIFDDGHDGLPHEQSAAESKTQSRTGMVLTHVRTSSRTLRVRRTWVQVKVDGILELLVRFLTRH